MQVNPYNETNLYPIPETEPTVHIHVQQVPVQPQQAISISVLRPEHIPYLKYLILNILMPSFHVTLRDVNALGRVSKAFKKKIMIDLEENNYFNKPASFLNICRMRYLFSNTFSNTEKDPMTNIKIQQLIKLESSLGGIKLHPFPYIHHLQFFESFFAAIKQEDRHELNKLRNFTALRSLKLPYFSENDHRPQTPSTDDYFTQMTYLTQLQHLSLGMDSSRFSPDNSLERLSQLTSLKSLSIETEIENADQWKAMTKLSSITLHLKLSISSITHAGLNALCGLTALRKLEIHNCRTILASHLAPLAGSLQELKFCDNLAHLICHPKDMIFLQGEDAHALKNFTLLQSLSLSCCKITEIALVELNKLSTLQKLELMYAGVTIDHLAQLRGLTALRSLTISLITPDVYEDEDNWGEDKLWQLPALQTVTIVNQARPGESSTFTRP